MILIETISSKNLLFHKFVVINQNLQSVRLLGDTF